MGSVGLWTKAAAAGIELFESSEVAFVEGVSLYHHHHHHKSRFSS